MNEYVFKANFVREFSGYITIIADDEEEAKELIHHRDFDWDDDVEKDATISNGVVITGLISVRED